VPRPSIASITEHPSHFRCLQPEPSPGIKISIWSPSRLGFCPRVHIIYLSNTESTISRTLPRHWSLTTLSFRIVPFRLPLQTSQTLQPLKALQSLKSFTEHCQKGQSPVSSWVPQSVSHSSYSVSFGPFGLSKGARP
jgi:hypothetical protein